MSIRSWEHWFKAENIDVWMDHGDAIELMHLVHPRTIFLKTLPRHSAVLDVGAGSGSLPSFKSWPKPDRKDLRMYAYAMEKGEGFDLYDAFEIGMWPDQKPEFAGKPINAIFCCHFIEHIPHYEDFLKWACRKLDADGRIYLEWPSEHSRTLPPREEFHQSKIPIVISNFSDDTTHREIPDRRRVINILSKFGMSIDQQGFVHNPFIDDEIRAHFMKGDADEFSLQSALWSKSRWAQYVIAAKV